jgi:hypothetical protein
MRLGQQFFFDFRVWYTLSVETRAPDHPFPSAAALGIKGRCCQLQQSAAFGREAEIQIETLSDTQKG